MKQTLPLNPKPFWLVTAGLLLLGVFFDLPLWAHNQEGILNLEFSGFYGTFSQMLKAWGNTGPVWASFSIGYDFLFIAGYVTAFLLTCMGLGERLRSAGSLKTGRLLKAMSGLAILAGAFDVIENLLLLFGITGFVDPSRAVASLETLSQAAAWAASFKFGLISTMVLCIAYGHRHLEKTAR